MKELSGDEHVIPRPVERLPDYANARARKSLASRLVDAFGLAVSADVIADAVVDPTAVRKSIGDPTEANVERIPVPGGTLLGVRTKVWARRVLPDPRNPRTLPARRHPFAVEPGAGGEDSKFRPLPDPRLACKDEPNKAELAVDVESRHHLTWATQQAADFVLGDNDWRASIASQGVMEAVWLVATVYEHADGSAAATALTTVEGSSRITAVHDLLQIRSSDVPYDGNPAKLRAHVRRLNHAYERGPDGDDAVGLRCECVPALIIVGFTPHEDSATRFPTAVKSLVALRHVDPPKPWGDGPEFESLADEVLAELHRRDLISTTELAYFAGACTKAEARAAHLPPDPISRATRIVHLFTNSAPRVEQAIRVAVTSQSTRKRITQRLLNHLATVLVLRAVAEAPNRLDQIRRYLHQSLGRFLHVNKWEPTGRSDEQLVQDAIAEVKAKVGNPESQIPTPSSVELAVRATYPLVVSGRLNADRGTAGNDQPDRRTPGEILDVMRSSLQGVRQLGQAVQDFQRGKPIRAVDEDGRVKPMGNGSGELPVSDIYLRSEFPPPGRAKKAANPGTTPHDRFLAAQVSLEAALDGLASAYQTIIDVRGHDGEPLVNSLGVEAQVVKRWRGQMQEINDEMIVWARTYQTRIGRMESASGSTGLDDDAGA